MNIIDAHHHIWRQADLPWLLGPEQPRIFGPYKAIKRDYLIDEFLDDIKGIRDHQIGLCAGQLGTELGSRRGGLGAVGGR